MILLSCLKSGDFDLKSIVFIVLKSTHAFLGLYIPVLLCVYFSYFTFLLLYKHHNQKQRREERICLAYSSHSMTKGRQAGAKSELEQRSWRNVAHCLLPLAPSAVFLIQPRPACPQMLPPVVGCSISISN